ncbi:MAG: pseudaminic acid synthase [Syntrophales bacterium]|nr:pseudaminic acid synthase [Syntrophales bacterium]
MADSIVIGKRKIGRGFPVYIVAEMSANHKGSLAEAEKIIYAAKAAGADAVKIQTYTPDTLTIDCGNEHFRIRGTLWDGRTLYELYGEAFTPWEWHAQLKQAAQDAGLDFFATSFDFTAVDFLERLGVPAHKVASFEITDIPLLEKIAATGKPVIISTGMSSAAEIEEAVETVRTARGGGIALLKCTSAYPAPPEEMNLLTIADMERRFRLPVGLSDHTPGIEASVAAVALGACIVEKHFTLSRSASGPDSAFSLEPHEFRSMTEAVRNVEKALGEVRYGAGKQEAKSLVFRRSLFVVKDMAKGEIFTGENVRSIRPGYGLPPKHFNEIIGCMATEDIPRGTPLAWPLVSAKSPEEKREMSTLRRCTNCVIPETHETITFDRKGVCNICLQQEVKASIDWSKKKEEFDALIASCRGRGDYDCIVPFSGGKDSTWTLYYLVREYGLRPLVVRFDHGFLRPNLLENSRRTLRLLGADLHSFTPNWKIVQKLMLQSFLEKGDFCWHCHTGIFAYPMWAAIRFQIPLVIWGEPSAEYTAYYCYGQEEEVDEKRFNRYINLGITAEDMLVRLEGQVDPRDLQPFSYPPLKELRKINCRSVCMGSYIPWDVKRQSKIIEDDLGWTGDEVENVPPGYSYEKIECYLQGVRDYIKYIKRGYTRPAHLASIDIRNGRLTRPEAMALVEQYEGKRPPSLDLFLEHLGLTEEEFLEVSMSHGVSPYRHDPCTVKEGTKTHDFLQWPKYGKMPRNETLQQLERWRRRNRVDKKLAAGA